ncbi:hypothetical protein LTR62_006595 [Meristemomyces frigidus]|uniref:Sm protein B n=1 Tax=Meristemomyces frigidus TaxID=1508187 RepID=A0AAN7TC44_9PEZI|nr:hypothetical protein LTR62_006595 [Meristemomyces frigidus]
MAAPNKQGKMQGFINYRMRATMKDGRQLVGQMLAFDKHMNLVLVDCEEYRKVKRKTKAGGAPGASAPAQTVETEEKRSLGLAIIRGAHVVSCSVDGPPPTDPAARMGTSAATPSAATVNTPGISRPAGRGAGLQGPMGGQGAFPGFPGGAPPMGRGGFAPPAGFGGGQPPGFAPPGFQPPGRGGFGGR